MLTIRVPHLNYLKASGLWSDVNSVFPLYNEDSFARSAMKLEIEFRQLIKEAVREVIEEEIQRGRLQPGSIPNHLKPAKPPTVEEPLKPRDPNSIVRPSELAEMLSVSKPTLWRWEQSGQLPSRIHLAGRAVGWRYGDIVAWLNRK